MARRSKRRGQPLVFAYKTLLRPCHDCGLPIEGGTHFSPFYGEVYHPQCLRKLWLQGGGR